MSTERVYLEDYPRYKPPKEEEGEYVPSIEVVLAEAAVEEAEDTLRLIELADLWGLIPEEAAQVIADSTNPGATYGEMIAYYLREARDNAT